MFCSDLYAVKMLFQIFIPAEGEGVIVSRIMSIKIIFMR